MPKAEVRARCRDVRGEVRRHPARGVRAPRRPRRLGASVPHDGPRLRGRRGPRPRPVHRRGAASTAARSRCTGARRASTALAEAEVEYADVTSPSVYVAFPFVEPLPAPLAGLDGVAAAAWTTTPWTLPANLAVAVHPEHEYVAVEIGGRVLVVAAALVARAREGDGRRRHAARAARASAAARSRARAAGIRGSTASCRSCSPTTSRSRAAPARAHRARPRPGGLRDRASATASTCSRRSTTAAASPPTCRSGRASASSTPTRRSSSTCAPSARCSPRRTFAHSYPHCWRCKNPIIFRATEQWFIGMERQRAARSARSPRSTACAGSRRGAATASTA